MPKIKRIDVDPLYTMFKEIDAERATNLSDIFKRHMDRSVKYREFHGDPELAKETAMILDILASVEVRCMISEEDWQIMFSQIVNNVYLSGYEKGYEDGTSP